MSLLDDIIAKRRMNSNEFTLYEHCSRQGDMPNTLWDFAKAEPRDGWTYIGWVPSASTCLPLSGWGDNEDYPIAVMLENGACERVWLHVRATRAIIKAGYGAS